MAIVDRLEVKNVRKQIGNKLILKDISFVAETGDLYALVGPNGAGKTTLFRLLASLSPKTHGEILYNGASYDLSLGKIAFLGHQPMLYEGLQVQENLAFFLKMKGTYSKARLEELLRLVDLWLYRYEPVAILSRGMAQRLALACVLAYDPRVILYDEPFTGLDQDGQVLLRSILREKQRETIQLVITHELAYLDDLAYKSLYLKAGEIVRGGF